VFFFFEVFFRLQTTNVVDDAHTFTVVTFPAALHLDTLRKVLQKLLTENTTNSYSKVTSTGQI